MAIGKVNSPDGPAAYATLGTVEDTNGKIIFFLNTANLKKDEPVLFDVRAVDLKIDNQQVKLKIASLELNEKGIPVISEKPWPKKFKEKWEQEWEKVSDERILKMKMKKSGKSMDKRNILAIQDATKSRL
jgi:hypothetical protein